MNIMVRPATLEIHEKLKALYKALFGIGTDLQEDVLSTKPR